MPLIGLKPLTRSQRAVILSLVKPGITLNDDILKDASILVVDDKAIVRDFFTEYLNRRGVNVQTAVDGKDAAQALDVSQPDLIIADLKMPNMDGMELLRYVVGHHPSIPVIILTAHGDVSKAVSAMQLGAFDFVEKKGSALEDLDDLQNRLLRALSFRRLLEENRQLRGEINDRYRFDRLVGPSPQMQRIFELIATVAPTPTTVLVLGGSGTGKELVARAIHFNSPRAKAPFVKVNCAAMPEGLIESELFGHERGAFTGAVRTTQGKFEAAHGGTLLLDEIGELPLGLQGKLLRVLQEREFQRIGSNETVKVDVRLIATTNVDLDSAIKDGKFRQDLYYRLNIIPIKLPPLSQRREDIPILAFHFLRRYAKLHGRKLERISDHTLRWLAAAPWPGNVRELENAIERAVVLCRGDQIEISDFFLHEAPPAEASITGAALPSFPASSTYVGGEVTTLAELEKHHILSVLRAQNGHRAQTAELLGISIRTLRNKLNEYREAGGKID